MVPLQDVISILESYKYFLIFPIAVVEGPIIIVISGFLIYLGFLDPTLSFILLLCADVTGDCMFYFIGRYWKKWEWGRKYAKFIGFDEKTENLIERHFENHTIKTLAVAKFSHGVGALIQITSGIAKIDFKKFIKVSMVGTAIKTTLLLFIGFYIGNSYSRIDKVFKSIAMFTLSLVVLGFIIYIVVKKYTKHFIVEEE